MVWVRNLLNEESSLNLWKKVKIKLNDKSRFPNLRHLVEILFYFIIFNCWNVEVEKASSSMNLLRDSTRSRLEYDYNIKEEIEKSKKILKNSDFHMI